MRDERMRFNGIRPYLNNQCLSGIARRSCDNNCSPSTVLLICRIIRNWGWTDSKWEVILAEPWLINTFLPIDSFNFIQKSGWKKICVGMPILWGPWEDMDTLIDFFKWLNYIRVQLTPEGNLRTFRKSINFSGFSRTINFLIRSFGRSRSALVNCPGPNQWLNYQDITQKNSYAYQRQPQWRSNPWSLQVQIPQRASERYLDFWGKIVTAALP